MEDFIKVDFEKLIMDVALVLQKHGLNPESLRVSIAVNTENYNKIDPKYRFQSYPDMIYLSASNAEFDWNIKLLRKLDAKDLPTDFRPNIMNIP
jgi:hypothetical protein